MNRVIPLAALAALIALPAHAQRVVPGALVARLAAKPSAVTPLAPVQAKKRVIPAGLPLARVELKGSTAAAWCDMRPPNGIDQGSIDCLADTDGDGRPDRLAVGLTSQAGAPTTVARVALDAPIAPVAVRADPAEAQPVQQTAAAPPKAAPVAAAPRPPARETPAEFARRRGLSEEDAALVQTLVEANRTGGQKAVKSALTKAWESMSQAPLTLTGEPQTHTGALKRGDVLLSGPVAHGITGRLKTAVERNGWTHDVLPAGQPMFGVPMSVSTYYGKTTDSEVVWCALRVVTDKKGARRANSVCLPRRNGVNHWVEVPGLFVDGLAVSDKYGQVGPAPVEPQPVDFGVPMTLAYSYGGVQANDMVVVDVGLRSEFGVQRLRRQTLKRTAGGFAELPAPGGTLRITPAADGKSADVAFLPGATARQP